MLQPNLADHHLTPPRPHSRSPTRYRTMSPYTHSPDRGMTGRLVRPSLVIVLRQLTPPLPLRPGWRRSASAKGDSSVAGSNSHYI